MKTVAQIVQDMVRAEAMKASDRFHDDYLKQLEQFRLREARRFADASLKISRR